jgi:hypothetical protein
MKGNKLTALMFLIIVLIADSIAGAHFLSMREDEIIHQGPGVSNVKMLSDYTDVLKDSVGDTEIYVFQGDESGGSMLVLGGTHPNEPASMLTAVTMIENLKVEAGTVYVIPRANKSAFTHNDATEGSPSFYKIGDRTFRYGSRATNPVDQWPDPDIYIHASSGQQLSGSETRNLNRAYPGRPDGTLTERVAYGITEFIKTEDITMVIDLHEASPEYPVINAMVTHERAMPIASNATINMELNGVPIGLEQSPKNLHGLTHRELGDYTDTYALLMETANPAQGRLRGKTDEHLVVTGIDPTYVKAYEAGKLFVHFDDAGHPMESRVGRHLTGLMEYATALTELEPEHKIIMSNIPTYDDLMENGLENYLK